MEETTWNKLHLRSPENIYTSVNTCRGQGTTLCRPHHKLHSLLFLALVLLVKDLIVMHLS